MDIANTKTQRHEGIATPSIRPINAETRRRGGAESLSGEFSPWRGPGHRLTTAGDRWDILQIRSPAIVTGVCPSSLRSGSAGLATPTLYLKCDGHAHRPSRKAVRRNRRAPGASVGGKRGCDERLRSEQTGFPPAGGDPLIADCSAVNPRPCRITSATTSSCLCVFVFAMCAALRLRDSVFLLSVFLLCVSVPLWFNRLAGGHWSDADAGGPESVFVGFG